MRAEPESSRVLLMARRLDLGGSERQLTEMARRLGDFGFEPHVACLLPGGLRARELEDAGVPVYCLGVPSFRSAEAVRGARRLAAYIRQRGIRLLHTFDWPATVYGVPVARAFTRAAVLSSQRAHRGLIPKAWRAPIRWTDRLANGVVVNCEFVRRHLVEDERVPAGKIHVCYNGIDLERCSPAAGIPAAGIPAISRDAGVVIGTASALRPEKGVGLLLAAFAKARQAHAGIRLVIVGDGAELPDLRRRAQELGIPDSVFQPGTADVTRWFRAMDIMVLPSVSEALSNSLMEAMACGCCVVASRVGGNPELIRDGSTGLLFDSGSSESLAAALDSLIGNGPLRQRMGEAAARFIRERFSLAAAARRMAEIYSGTLRRRT